MSRGPPLHLFVDVNAGARWCPSPSAQGQRSLFSPPSATAATTAIPSSQPSHQQSHTWPVTYAGVPASSSSSPSPTSSAVTNNGGGGERCVVEEFEMQLRSQQGLVVHKAVKTLFGKVYKVQRVQDGKLLCVKVSDRQKAKRGCVPGYKEQVAAENVEMELILLSSLLSHLHPCALTAGVSVLPGLDPVQNKLYRLSSQLVIALVPDVVQTPISVICVTTEWLDGGSLFDLKGEIMKTQDPDLVLLLALCMLLSVYHLHVRSIAHLDVSLENFVVHADLARMIRERTYVEHAQYILTNGLIKLIDFGMATGHFLQSVDPRSNQVASFAAPQMLHFSRTPSPSPLVMPGAALRVGAESPMSHLTGVFSSSTTLMSPTSASRESSNMSPEGVHSRSGSVMFCNPPPLGSPMRFLCRTINPGRTIPGKPHYVSPELMERRESGWEAYRADLQAIGKCIWYLVIGRLPPDNQEFANVRNNPGHSYLDLLDPTYASRVKKSSGWTEIWTLIRTLIRPQEHIPDVDLVILGSPTFRQLLQLDTQI